MSLVKSRPYWSRVTFSYNVSDVFIRRRREENTTGQERKRWECYDCKSRKTVERWPLPEAGKRHGRILQVLEREWSCRCLIMDV